MSRQHFTLDAQKALSLAQQAAEVRHSPMVGTEHVLLGCLSTDLVKAGLAATGVDAAALQRAIEDELGAVRDEPLPAKGLSVDVKKMLEKAVDISRTQGAVSGGHMAVVMLQRPEPYLAQILTDLPQFNSAVFTDYIQSHAPKEAATTSARSQPTNVLSIQDYQSTGRKSRRQRQAELRNMPPHLRPKEPPRPKPTENPNLPIYIGLGILAAILYGAVVAPSITIAVVIVAGGWIVSLVMHEFAHALVAYWGGDHTVVDKGYLSLNPLKYTHPLLSIGLPLFFLAIGGIGLPGGAVYIERHRLRSKIWNSYVSAAGPFATFICMIVFSSPFWLGYVTWERYFDNQVQWSSLAFLVWLQGIAIVLNLLPIPPLDGFGIIEPFLPDDLAFQLRSFGSIGFLVIILLFWIPDSGTGFHPGRLLVEQADTMSEQLDVEPWQVTQGYYAFRFWD